MTMLQSRLVCIFDEKILHKSEKQFVIVIDNYKKEHSYSMGEKNLSWYYLNIVMKHKGG